METPEDAVERAMVAIRRSQSRRTLARLADADGIDPTLLGVLDAIEGRGRPCTVTEIAADLHVDQPRASRLVARCLADGLLTRHADHSDGRRSPVALTTLARDRLAHARAQRRAVFGAAMAAWPETDRATFARLLTDFVTSFTDVVQRERRDPDGPVQT
ncbi:MarR family winged helix-turn-helix transcriptional regulator [Actinomadura flavalba]|uniref:MarR family winged helix-turn-helix transcriptional regulator n=1 Tax=Actinomadura flavalba TaxID=1120938 RepID=UPI00036B7411|nr:MarR family winged helix-turn-helix transcriptional regulator [Actinomadura flavalba]